MRAIQFVSLTGEKCPLHRYRPCRRNPAGSEMSSIFSSRLWLYVYLVILYFFQIRH